MIDYADFIKSKSLVVKNAGFTLTPDQLNPTLFDWQRQAVVWALRKGRAAIFENTGLGKTYQELEWANAVHLHTGGSVLLVAPLGVAFQTIEMARNLGLEVHYCQRQADVKPGLNITNYERIENFDTSHFAGVALDESSILKSFEGKIRTQLIDLFESTPYRLACTATPAPNDIEELCNHAEFLGIMSRVEMLATFFIHDDKGWRLKKHGRDKFYQWLASWSISARKPSDMGQDFSDAGYDLPGLSVNPIFVKSSYVPEGKLFHDKLQGVTERAQVRKATLSLRVEEAARLINEQPNEQWLVWCGLNDEGQTLAKALPGAVVVEGSDKPEVKAERLTEFAKGNIRILITKASIAGFGMNFQSCARMVFVGLSDSYEQFYQAIRRCYRFGQTRPVEVYIVLSDVEEDIYRNILRKQKEAELMTDQLVKHVQIFQKEELQEGGIKRHMEYQTKDVHGKNFHLMLGDSGERLKELADNSIDLSIFSPPFATLYTYSNSERDLGNSRNPEEFWQHFSFISPELLRVMKPGRNVCVHVQQITTQKAKDGVIGLSDFRGETIRHFVSQGFIYHGEVCIDKDPQAQAIRTKSKALLFTQFHKDSSWSRPALADYILIFRKPGDNAVPIHPDVTNNEWIEWARPIWYNIKETDTLNTVEARSEDDERHICPLQLGTIERCVHLWSNKGETVLTPFLGIGSEVYQAVKLGRKGIGCELKPEYFNVAVKNVKEAERQSTQEDIFSFAGIEVAV